MAKGGKKTGLVRNVISSLAAVLLAPVCVALTMSLIRQISNINQLSEIQVYFLAGIVSYMVLDSILYRPMYLYVLGHELTHVFSAWLCGGKVTSFKVSSSGGEVTATKENLFISLAPYFVPLYTIIFSLAIFLVKHFYNPLSEYQNHFIFILGVTWSFHLVLTAHFLKTSQPDFIRWGYLFSVVIIYIVNLVILALLLTLVFSQVSAGEFFFNAFQTAQGFYTTLYRQLFL